VKSKLQESEWKSRKVVQAGRKSPKAEFRDLTLKKFFVPLLAGAMAVGCSWGAIENFKRFGLARAF
jgi:hypothetical protein